MQGNGNFEYGNNKNDTIIPGGNNTLEQKSFIYNNTPGFWNTTSLWPSIGINNHIGTGTIPAKERINIAPIYCLSQTPVTYIFTGNGNWNIAANWNNNAIPPAVLSDGSEIIINPIAGGKCVLNIPYTINPGAVLTVRPGKQFEVGANLTFVK